MSDILEDVKVSHIDVVSEYGAAHSQSQMIERVDSFIQTL